MSEVLSQENQNMVAQAHCWTAELENRQNQEYHGERLRPFYLMRPKLFLDGDQWCCLYGENIQDGLAGFGPTPAKAAWAFDEAFYGPKTVPVARARISASRQPLEMKNER